MRGRVIEIDCEPSGEALKVLRQIENLDEVALYGSLVHVVAHDVAAQQPLIENALREAQITVNSVNVIPPSLEDVFIARAKG
jgi:hypothetical protein